jgi:hypothetical protein
MGYSETRKQKRYRQHSNVHCERNVGTFPRMRVEDRMSYSSALSLINIVHS